MTRYERQHRAKVEYRQLNLWRSVCVDTTYLNYYERNTCGEKYSVASSLIQS